MNKALYFPYIRVPCNQWFTQVLLYWDEVATIVPYEYIHNPEKLGDYMVELLQNGLLNQVIPTEHIYSIPNFTEAFIEYIDSINLETFPTKQKWINIHIEKMGDIAQELCSRKLAIPDRYPWFTVEPQVGKAFMTYLACILGKLSDLNFVPITDQPSSMFFPFGTNNFAYLRRLQQLRGLILPNLLPIPDGSVSLNEIAKFKHDYCRQLHRFRTSIEAFITKLAAVEDETAKETIFKAEMELLNMQIEDIVEAMKRRKKWSRINFGNLFSIGGALIPLTQINAHSDIMTSVGASARLLGAVFKACSPLLSSQILDQPLAYAAIARTNFQKSR